MHKSISEPLRIFLTSVVEKALAAEIRQRALSVVGRMAANSKSSKYQIYSSAAFFMPPNLLHPLKGSPTRHR